MGKHTVDIYVALAKAGCYTLMRSYPWRKNLLGEILGSMRVAADGVFITADSERTKV